MIDCLIIEDEPLARDVLIQYIDDHPDLNLLTYAKDALEATSVLEKGDVDLIFLDINLPKISGINFYKSLVNQPPVIFTTAYPEYAVEGFEVSAVDYLVKPFSFERFVKAINKFKNWHKVGESNSHLNVKTDKKVYRIPFDDISHIESTGDYMKIHTKDRVLISADTLKNLVETLPSDIFFRIHKSYLVNVEHVEFLEGNRLKVNDKMLPVGYSYREKISALFRR